MNKKLILSILSISLLNLFGCYSVNQITIEEMNSIDDIEDVYITTKDSINYSFEKYSSINRMLNDPKKYYFENWQVNDDTLTVSGYSLKATSTITQKLLNKDNLIIPFDKISNVSENQFDSYKTIMSVLAWSTIPILILLTATVLNPFG